MISSDICLCDWAGFDFLPPKIAFVVTENRHHSKLGFEFGNSSFSSSMIKIIDIKLKRILYDLTLTFLVTNLPSQLLVGGIKSY